MRLFLIFFLLFSSLELFAQLGSPLAFRFLNLSPSARLTALGGMQMALGGEDSLTMASPGSWWLNPAANFSSGAQRLSVSYQPYYADIDHAGLGFSHGAGKHGSWALGVQFLNYGKIDSFDPSGLPQGDFSAQEYVLVFNRAHQQGPFRLGVNTKLAFSQLAGFGASALLFDIGGLFVHPRHDFRAGLTISHLGLLLNDYTSMTRSRLPTDLRLGLSYKPRYMPFRFHLGGYFLLQHYRGYFGQDNNELPGYVNKILRHASLGGTLLISRNFHVLIGYNHMKANTLQLAQLGGGAGLSFGFSLRLRYLQLDFSRAFYHVAGGVSHLSLTTDLERLIFKR
jgi:hypothetical protein